VDATNYVLWESGKPTHVFDQDLLEGRRIIVRHARAGETLKTLDGVERRLTSEDLVVADARKPVGLAGVMGGFDTMITEKTKNVLIESAWWNPITIRKMSKRHGIHTDASHRFERGADFESTVLSTNRVAELILQSSGGELVGDVVDVIAKRIDQAPVALHLSEVRRILGDQPTIPEIVRILRKLGFEIVAETTDASEWTVQIPSWRLDVEREIDLIEEIARLYGYDKFPNTLPAFAGAVIEQPEARKDATLRSRLLALGYNEAISLTFISHEDAGRFSPGAQIELANPLSEEASVMRTSMVPGMLDMLAYNLNRGTDDARLFEIGKVYEYDGDQPLESKRGSLGATGHAVLPGVHESGRQYSFFDMKGDVETLLRTFEHQSLCFDAHTADYYHPGRSARAVMDGATVAQFGQIHPQIAAARKLRQHVFIGELYLDQLHRHTVREVHYEALPRYPAVERDFSFTLPDSITFEQVKSAIANLGISELRSLIPAEIFRGGAIPAGSYSLLLRATFQSGERTLRDDEVAQWSAQIIKALEQLGGSLRS
jgi:phenylalanyl-tRNA synthetase beta chain